MADDNANSQPSAKKMRTEGQEDINELVGPSTPLEDRLSQILRCTVCLDLSADVAMYQVPFPVSFLLNTFMNT